MCALTGCAKKAEKYVIVINSRGGSIEGNQLILEDLNKSASISTIGTPRKIYLVPTQRVAYRWEEFFGQDEPNASLNIYYSANGSNKEIITVLQPPIYRNNKLIFTIKPLTTGFEGNFDEAVLYIDDMICEVGCTAWAAAHDYT